MTKRKSNLSLNLPKRHRHRDNENKDISNAQKRKRIFSTPSKRISFRPWCTNFQGTRLGCKTPSKTVRKSPSKSPARKIPRTQLFNESLINRSEDNFDMIPIGNERENSTLLDKFLELAPDVVSAIQRHDQGCNFYNLLQLIAQERFPWRNISYTLLSDIIQWHSKENTTCMRYSNESKLFWKLGWIIFGGKFIRFMSGFKNATQLISGETSRGKFKPDKADVNFAVPDISVLRSFSPYGTQSPHRSPGIFTDLMKDIATALQNTSACLSFDGKKLKQGLTDRTGDIDLLGFEKGKSLHQRQKERFEELDRIKEILDIITSRADEEDVQEMPIDLKRNICKLLKGILLSLSKYAQISRKTKVKKSYAKEKFIQRSGADWKRGQFVYVISAINALLFEIDAFLTSYKDVIEKICFYVSVLQGSHGQYILGKNVHLNACENYEALSTTESTDTRLVKQRSETWFYIRREGRVSGSTIYAAVGLDGLKKLQEHFERVVCKLPEKEKTESLKQILEYGTENEINAVSTLVSKVLPVLYPDLVYFEEGCIRLQYNGNTFMIVSPDGSIRHRINGKTVDIMSVEFKCPIRSLHEELPERYLLQCLAEMEALKVEKSLYVCWRPDLTSVFEVSHNHELFDRVVGEAATMYCIENPKRPTKLPNSLAEIRALIKQECNKAKFLGEFPSTFDCQEDCINRGFTRNVTNKDLQDLIKKLHCLLIDGYELQREKATEAMVFLCCDLDRNWSKDPFRWAPVCWFPKGYSLTNEIFRPIVEEVRNQCHQNGIHVPCSSFDGQWHNIAVRSVKGEPLTIYQLQKDVWRFVEKTQKSQIVKAFSTINMNPTWTITRVRCSEEDKRNETVHILFKGEPLTIYFTQFSNKLN